jgi:hypothetical protein
MERVLVLQLLSLSEKGLEESYSPIWTNPRTPLSEGQREVFF